MEIIIAILGSGALSAFISGLFSLVLNRRAQRDGIRSGVRQLLYYQIKSAGREYIADGEISCEDLEDMIDIHKIYHDELNGNGYLDHVMEDVKKLKVITK